MLTKEQAQNIKEQLLEQIDSTFPEDKKEQARQQIQNMDEEELEEFLEKNNMMKKEGETQCIFCSIVSEKIPSYKIDENEKAIAILEINPISSGHILVLPKEHISEKENLSKEVLALAKKISKKIKSKLKPKEVKIFFSNFMGHECMNVLPIYGEENEKSPRKKAEEKELEGLVRILKEKNKTEKVKRQKIEKVDKPKGKIWLPRRIP